jgi:hypothetical protein
MAGTDILSLITYSYIKRFKMERRGQGRVDVSKTQNPRRSARA